MSNKETIAFDIATVDAFTNRPFKGNPAAVVLLQSPISDHIMKKIAFEMNLAETAFAHPINRGEQFSSAQKWNLRWFTPTMEVDLCGHATLATSHVINNIYENKNAVIEFETRSGALFVTKHNNSYSMEFPIYEHFDYSEEGRTIAKIASCDLTINNIFLAPDIHYMFVVVDEKHTDEELGQIQPDFARLSAELNAQIDIVQCCAITKRSDSAFDYVCRFFDPPMGTNEDPATGSLQCVLAPYWGKILNKKQLCAKQLFPNRGGEFALYLHEDKIKIVGDAVTIIKGRIEIEI